jgi:hypothetical protein
MKSLYPPALIRRGSGPNGPYASSLTITHVPHQITEPSARAGQGASGGRARLPWPYASTSPALASRTGGDYDAALWTSSASLCEPS